MQKDYGLYLLLICCFIVLTLTWNDYEGYSKILSDWRGIECDWATNNQVARFYGNDSVKFFRPQHFQKFKKYVLAHDTTVIGYDYYALNICYGMVPKQLVDHFADSLLNGRVETFKLFKTDSGLVWIR